MLDPRSSLMSSSEPIVMDKRLSPLESIPNWPWNKLSFLWAPQSNQQVESC